MFEPGMRTQECDFNQYNLSLLYQLRGHNKIKVLRSHYLKTYKIWYLIKINISIKKKYISTFFWKTLSNQLNSFFWQIPQIRSIFAISQYGLSIELDKGILIKTNSLLRYQKCCRCVNILSKSVIKCDNTVIN